MEYVSTDGPEGGVFLADLFTDAISIIRIDKVQITIETVECSEEEEEPVIDEEENNKEQKEKEVSKTNKRN